MATIDGGFTTVLDTVLAIDVHGRAGSTRGRVQRLASGDTSRLKQNRPLGGRSSSAGEVGDAVQVSGFAVAVGLRCPCVERD